MLLSWPILSDRYIESMNIHKSQFVMCKQQEIQKMQWSAVTWNDHRKLAAYSRKLGIHPSVPSEKHTVTHQGAACDGASIHFGQTRRTYRLDIKLIKPTTMPVNVSSLTWIWYHLMRVFCWCCADITIGWRKCMVQWEITISKGIWPKQKFCTNHSLESMENWFT